MAVKVFRLVSGEEIIGDETSSSMSDSITLESPAAIVMQQTEKGVGVALVPFMAYAEGTKVTLYREGICAECVAQDELRNEYSRVYGSGIVIPTMVK